MCGRDTADAFGGQIKNLLVSSWVEDMLKTTKANRGMTASTKEIAKWAKTVRLCDLLCKNNGRVDGEKGNCVGLGASDRYRK